MMLLISHLLALTLGSGTAGAAPCIRPSRAGTQVQGEVRVCPGRYRIADPGRAGGDRRGGLGDADRPDRGRAGERGFGARSVRRRRGGEQGRGWRLGAGRHHSRVPDRPAPRGRTEPPGVGIGCLRQPERRASVHLRAAGHHRPSRPASTGGLHRRGRGARAIPYGWRQRHRSDGARGPERHRPDRCARQLSRRQRADGEHRVGYQPVAVLA